MKKITIQTRKRSEMIDITNQIQQYTEDLGLKSGFIVIYVPHTTAGVTINEGADPNVQKDLLHFLDRLVPVDKKYHHAEGNSDAHIKASIIGSSVTIILDKSKLALGTWQHIFFYEGDGPRSRTIFIAHYLNNESSY